MISNRLIDHLPEEPTADALLMAFLEWAESTGIEPYPHQEDAIVALFSGDNVVLATPTGSGKSLVGLAGAFAMVAARKRAFYTAPVKALVSEKFFEMTHELGADNVGMITGDASVNSAAPVIVCTAEILANMALRSGERTKADLVVMDEFHYYADRDRGWAWQVPLLELPNAAFLMMSATLGDTKFLRDDLTSRNGRQTTLVDNAERPVPLDFEYRETPLLDSIGDLLLDGRVPVYIVHFTQKDAATRAQSLTSLDVLTKDEKAEVKAAIGGFRFDTPIGKDLRRFVMAGIGLHHAGLLPKYRLLIEKLAQQGLLKLICGTDTLGVGINVPIRTVLFTQLCKYDGRRVRVLSVRDFQQIAGRAGRKGFDTAGSVLVQAPEHVVENRKAAAKAEADPKKKRKLVKHKAPQKGYAHWDGDTLTRLQNGRPETLTSSFSVNHAMLLNMLDRPGDGCSAMKNLLTDNHENRKNQRRHIRRAVAVFRSLVEAGIIERLDQPDDLGRPVRINLDLQDDFRLNQPLALFVVEAVEALDRDLPDHYLQVLSLVESVLDDPMTILFSQLDKAKGDLVNELKSQGVEYEQRMEKLDELTWPKPEREFIEPAFEIFARHHPWVGREQVSPKSIAREMLQHAETFNQYVNRYGLKRCEGLLLRYLTDCYKTLIQTVPAEHRTEDLDDVVEWLGATIRHVDSSLIDEWERLRNPGDESEEIPAPESPDITHNRRAFEVMLRNEMFRWVTLLARHKAGELVRSLADPGPWTPDVVVGELRDFWDEHDLIAIDGDARARQWVNIDLASGLVRQTICDADGFNEWVIDAVVDVAASSNDQRAVVVPVRIHRL